MFYRTSEKYLKVDATPKKKQKQNLVHAQNCLFFLEMFFIGVPKQFFINGIQCRQLWSSFLDLIFERSVILTISTPLKFEFFESHFITCMKGDNTVSSKYSALL